LFVRLWVLMVLTIWEFLGRATGCPHDVDNSTNPGQKTNYEKNIKWVKLALASGTNKSTSGLYEITLTKGLSVPFYGHGLLVLRAHVHCFNNRSWRSFLSAFDEL